MYCSQFWRLGSPRLRCQHGHILVRTLLLVHSCVFLCLHVVEGTKELFYKSTNPFIRTPPSQRSPLLTLSHWSPTFLAAASKQYIWKYIYFTHGMVYMSMLLSQFVPPSLSPPCAQVHSLHLNLYSCPANRHFFFNDIFQVKCNKKQPLNTSKYSLDYTIYNKDITLSYSYS